MVWYEVSTSTLRDEFQLINSNSSPWLLKRRDCAWKESWCSAGKMGRIEQAEMSNQYYVLFIMEHRWASLCKIVDAV